VKGKTAQPQDEPGTKFLVVAPFIVALAFVLSISSRPAWADDPAVTGALAAVPAHATSCGGLASLSLPYTTISMATLVPAGPFTPPGSTTAYTVPEFCRVAGDISPTSDSDIKFEVWMPTGSSWNGRFLTVYNGGFSGAIPYTSAAGTSRIPGLVDGLILGYATAGTDTGHEGTAAKWGSALLDASWALGHPEKVIDFGYRGVHLTAVMAEAITRAFYAMDFFSYFDGCSGGGRAALISAQRYPGDFDGIVAGDPTIDFTHLIAGGRFWEIIATEKDIASYIPDSKVSLLYNAVNSACNAVDDVVSDPRECHFDPATIQCRKGVDNDTCLTGPQVTALRKIYAGPGNLNGKPIYFGYLPGGELDPGGWGSNVTGLAPGATCSPLSTTTTCPGQWDYAISFLQDMVYENDSWNWLTWSYQTGMPYADNKLEAGERLADVVNGENANLEPFKDLGGKLIHYHGYSDIGVSPLASIDYYERAVAAMKHGQGDPDERDLRSTQEFYRLYMVPGMHHCVGGPGADTFDPLTAVVQWREQGIAPEQMPSSHISSAAFPLSFVRPLCPYPQEVGFTGGDPTLGSNFVCRSPKWGH
jgi:feruloyl esterase